MSKLCFVRYLAWKTTGKIIGCEECIYHGKCEDEEKTHNPKISRKRCGSCIYCKPVYNTNGVRFCNNELAKHSGNIVSYSNACCGEYAPKNYRRPKQPYIDDYHTRIGGNVFHICEFAEKMNANGAIYKPEETVTLEQQEHLIEAMEVAGMHYDIYDSTPDALRFTSEMGIVTYFENWDEVTNWIEGTVFDDPDIESEVDEILHPDKYEKAEEMTVHCVL